MRGTIDPSKIENDEVNCPSCNKKIKLNGGKCPCGVKLHCYKKRKGGIEKITWCGPSNNKGQ